MASALGRSNSLPTQKLGYTPYTHLAFVQLVHFPKLVSSHLASTLAGRMTQMAFPQPRKREIRGVAHDAALIRDFYVLSNDFDRLFLFTHQND